MEVITLFIPTYMHATVEAITQIHGDWPVHVKKVSTCGAATKSGKVGSNCNHYYPNAEKHPRNAIGLAEMEYQPHHRDVNRHHEP